MAWKPFSALGNSARSLAKQRWIVATIIDQRLALLPGAPTLWVEWDGRNPTLTIESGMGFIRAAWLHVAQLAAGVRSLYICDGCGKPYPRRRQAKKGQKQFCPECGARASKRLWWREHRGTSATGRGKSLRTVSRPDPEKSQKARRR
jgi:DNA-directed RNA polymerase subunit RPC12/RpoP